MHESTLAKRYSLALAELATEQHLLDTVGRELNVFHEAYKQTPALRVLMSSPTSTVDEQSAVIENFLNMANFSAITGNFLRLLTKKRRMTLIDAIVRAFNRELEERSGQLTIHIQSAQELQSAQRQALQAALSRYTGKSVQVEVTTDAALLGGLVVRIGSLMLDYSLRSQLARLKTRMVTA